MAEIELNPVILDEQRKKLLQIAEAIERRIIAWENYLAILESQELLERFNKRWNSLKRARQLRSILLFQGIERFEAERATVIQDITTNNPRLSRKIADFIPVPEKVIPKLAYLLTLLKQDKSTAVGYIATNSEELIDLVDSIKDEEFRTKLRRLITDISGKQIDELNKCIADLHRWKDFVIGNDIPFFQNRVRVYLHGGKLEAEEFLGLARYFQDKSLVTSIKESSALMMLLTYQMQLDFFRNKREVVAYATQNPGWEGFRGPNGFYDNLTKGENYVRKVRDEFGNERIAEFLRVRYTETGEYPAGWLKDIDLILLRIQHPSYKRKYVIVPSADDLIRIFERKGQELMHRRDFDSLLRELNEVLKRELETEIKKSRNSQAFEAILRRELDMLEEDTAKEKRELTKLLRIHGSLVLRFIDEQSQLITSSEIAMDNNVASALQSRIRQLRIISSQKAIKPTGDKPSQSAHFAAAILSMEENIGDIQVYVDEDKISALNNVRATLERIMGAMIELPEIRKQISAVDAELNLAIGDHFISRRNGKDLSIFDPEYLGAFELTERGDLND